MLCCSDAGGDASERDSSACGPVKNNRDPKEGETVAALHRLTTGGQVGEEGQQGGKDRERDKEGQLEKRWIEEEEGREVGGL